MQKKIFRGKKVLYWKIFFTEKKLSFTEKNVNENVKNISHLKNVFLYRKCLFYKQNKIILKYIFIL